MSCHCGGVTVEFVGGASHSFTLAHKPKRKTTLRTATKTVASRFYQLLISGQKWKLVDSDSRWSTHGDISGTEGKTVHSKAGEETKQHRAKPPGRGTRRQKRWKGVPAGRQHGRGNFPINPPAESKLAPAKLAASKVHATADGPTPWTPWPPRRSWNDEGLD